MYIFRIKGSSRAKKMDNVDTNIIIEKLSTQDRSFKFGSFFKNIISKTLQTIRARLAAL